MSRVFAVGALSLLLLAGAFACSSDESATPPASISEDDGGTKPPKSDAATSDKEDAGGEEPTPAKQTEVEPNNASSKTDLQAMTLPGEMTGKVDPANDIDAFSLEVAPGDLWEWTLTAEDDLAPHLVVFDTAENTLNPVRLAQGAAGGTASLAHFVLRPGSFAAIVRDARNVAKPPAGLGGPSYGYKLSAKKKTLTPVQVSLPSTKSGKLASLSALDFYSFTANEGTGFDIVLKAERKSAPSTLDSRITLFDLGSKKTIITNDDAAGTVDSEIGGNLPATSSYLLVVENEGTEAGDLSYELTFSLR